MQTLRNYAVGIMTAAGVVGSWCYAVWVLHVAVHLFLDLSR